MFDSRAIIQNLLNQYAREVRFPTGEDPTPADWLIFEILEWYDSPAYKTAFDGYYIHGPMADPFFCHQIELLLDRQTEIYGDAAYCDEYYAIEADLRVIFGKLTLEIGG